VAFVLVFPLTFLSSAFVPIDTLPSVLQWVASWNPMSVLVGATRELFGNPDTPLTKHAWPLEHSVLAAALYCAVLLVIGVTGALHRYRLRTTD
jgi:ABC-type polysaccharide/polyol phosphate export permease